MRTLLLTFAVASLPYFLGAQTMFGQPISSTLPFGSEKNFGTLSYFPGDCSLPTNYPDWFILYHGDPEYACNRDSSLYFYGETLDHRALYQYIENRRVEILFQSMFPDGWRNGERSQFSYNPQGKITQEIRHTWQAGMWQNEYVFNREYNSDGELSTITVQLWGNGSYQNNARLVHTYNELGQLVGLTVQFWSQGAWADENQYTYTYLSSGCILSEQIADLQVSVMTPSTRKTHTHDPQNRVIGTLVENYVNGLWIEAENSLYVYNNEGLMTTQSIQQPSANGWIDYYRSDISFDAQGLIASEVIHYTNGESLHPLYQVIYIHNNQGNMTSRLNQQNNQTTGVNWIDHNWWLAEFDNLGNRTSESYAESYEGEWGLWRVNEHYYDCATIGIGEAEAEMGLTLNPNPSTVGFQLTLSKGVMQSICLFDTMGKMVLMQTFAVGTATASISTIGIAPGMYVAHVQTDKGVGVQRVVIKNNVNNF